MPGLLRQLLQGPGNLLSSRGVCREEKRFARPCLERLEDRLALSSNSFAGYVPQWDAYVLAGQDSNPSGPIYKWSQPGGAGSLVTITYSYSNLLDGGMRGVSVAQLKQAVQEVLSRWAAVAPLKFVEVPDAGPAQSQTEYNGTNLPMIRFGHTHIDGTYNVLGYAYYPGPTYSGLAGDITFDDSELWSLNPSSGIDFLEVAEHELGHAIGMAHEPAPAQGGVTAIMNPVYGGRFSGLGTSFLYQDDINGIQALYGAGRGSVQGLDSTAGPSAQTSAFITKLYQLCLGRTPSQSEINNWSAVNDQAGSTAVAQGISNSLEARMYLVKGWYTQYLGRVPSLAEAQNWANAMQVQSEEQLLSGILGSTEFYNRAQTLFTGSADERYVRALYQALLGRTPSSGEVSSWVVAVQASGRAAVALGFLSSLEYRGLAVTANYTTILGRTPSAAEVYAWASSPLSLHVIRDAFLASGELFRSVG